jgi:hypothetical protein
MFGQRIDYIKKRRRREHLWTNGVAVHLLRSHPIIIVGKLFAFHEN